MIVNELMILMQVLLEVGMFIWSNGWLGEMLGLFISNAFLCYL